MILFKLIWMENSFDKIEKFEVLTPENVLLQLKYRYDREIDRHQRPALRKITERDEVPNRRIILKVIDIIYSLNVGYELDLSDGWYKIRACVDSCLAEAISRKKIVINTKLIICNSELINMFTNAYHPLELPLSVRLKIHGNSTRIASYDMKLGFCKSPRSFLIPVDSISSDGGIIGRLKLFITHVYTIIYVESNGEKKGKFFLNVPKYLNISTIFKYLNSNGS
jgi:breast cancer 2 susceptibility protein